MAERIETSYGASSAPAAPTPPPPPRKKIAKKKSYRSGGNSGGSNNNYRSNSLHKRSYGSSRHNNSDSTPRSPASATAKVIKPPAPPKPAPPTASAYLKGDTTYQRQLASYAKALADFQAEQGLSRTDYDTGYQNTRRDIGLAKTDALKNMENDYAARGLLRSSLYNTDVGNLNKEYQNQYTDLDKQRTSFLDQLMQQLTGYKNEQTTQQQNAMQEALRRRSEKYNL
jgi:hypothetical protein